MAGLKKIRELAEDLADSLELPQEAFAAAAKLSVTAGRRALIENHRGIIEYSRERIAVSVEKGRIIVGGHGLVLSAMNKSELLIDGKISMVEWE